VASTIHITSSFVVPSNGTGRITSLLAPASLVVLAAINAAGPSRISTIAKELVIFDLVNKFFQQVCLFNTVNMLL
jgi:hypothetical protein